MFHAITWVRKPYYRFDNLKDINIDHSNSLLNVTVSINESKEHTYNIDAAIIKGIKFCVRYNKSLDKTVFFMITYTKDNKDHMISFYLPRKYDKALIEDMKNFAQDREITFDVNKRLNPLIFIIGGSALISLLTYIMSL
jgi:hypothetical protein